MNPKSTVKNSIVLGLALFAMFFGAGNLIFPPAIGIEGGQDWFTGFIAYFVADVGLALFSVIAMLRADGQLDKVIGSVGRVPATVLNVAIIACIGPLLAIPRTAATTYEMGSAALFGSELHPLALPLFSLLFFALVLLFSLKPGTVVSNIGRVLTPLLVATLAALIIAGIVNPGAAAGPATAENLIQEGVLNGYQTMDVIAALIFSIIVVQTVKDFGAASRASMAKSVGLACGVSALMLFAVYGGLAYLGATTGQLWAQEYAAGTVNQAALLTNISQAVLGGTGSLFLAAAVFFACFTTAVGLVTTCSEYFHQLLGERVDYPLIAAAICGVSLLLCNVGLSQIIQISAPILMVVYPVALFLTVASLAQRKPGRERLACKLGALAALLVSLCSVLAGSFGVEAFAFVDLLPLGNLGFAWLLPTLVAAALGALVDFARSR